MTNSKTKFNSDLSKLILQKKDTILAKWKSSINKNTSVESQLPELLNQLMEVVIDSASTEPKSAVNEPDVEQLYDFFMQSPVPMVIFLGPEHRFAWANPPYIRFIGRDVIGKTINEVFTKTEMGDFEKLLNEVYLTGKPYEAQDVPLPWPDENGKIHNNYVDIGYYPFRNPDGTNKGVMVFMADVTKQVEARQIIEKSKAVIENERRNFRNLFKQSPEMVCILHGPEHQFEFVNEAHIRVLGFDATGMKVREAQPESVEVHSILDSVYQTGESALLHEIPVTVTKALRYFNLTYSARRGFDGEVNGVMILGTEVTEQVLSRKAIELSAKEFQSLADAMPQNVWVADEQGTIVYFNKQFYEDTGLTPEFALTGRWINVFHPDDLNKIMSVWSECILKGTPYRSEFRMMKAGEKDYRWYMGRSVPIRNAEGKVEKWYGTNTDIHDYKILMEELKQARSAAESASAAKSAFLANMSHEIRTPLGAIMGFVDLMRQPTLDREDLASYISIISRNSDQLLRLIDDILDLSKVEAGMLQIESHKFSLSQVVADFSSLMGVRARERSILFETKAETQLPDQIVSDPVRIRQILTNIVGNALKFTEKGEVKLSLSYEKPFLQMKVQDTGTGISPEQTLKLFQPFSQADTSTTRKFGGTGLGLVLTKRLTEAMGGEFWLEESELGKGSTFIAEVRIDVPEDTKFVDEEVIAYTTGTVSHDLLDGKPLQGINILVVEDSPDNQALIQIYLKKAGCQVSIAADGKIGVEMALNENFDLILMDIQMPQMDGHQATKLLRSKGYKKPIIALTAHAMKEERDRTKASGFSDFLSKPIQKDHLIEALSKHAAQLNR